MKKWFIIAVICGGLYYYAAHTEDGKKQFKQIANWFEEWTGQKVTSVSSGGDNTTIYKIQNPDGTWIYSNEKPADSSKVIEQEYRTDTNVLPSLTKDESKD